LRQDKFAWQVAYLKKHFNLMSLTELLLRVRDGAKLPPNPAVITFDDGFQNVYTNAYPILRKFGAPATVFLATGHIDTDTTCWPERLFLALRTSRVHELNMEDFGLESYALASVPARDAAFDRLCGPLKAMEAVEKNHILAEILSRLRQRPGMEPKFSADFRMLTWREIEVMNESGLIDFGGHTVNHEILSRMPRAEQQREIEESCDTLRKRLGVEHITFAYPNGKTTDFNSDTKDILRKVGALCGLSTIEGLCEPTDDPYALKRIGVGCNMTPQRFALLCSGFLPRLKASLSAR